MPKRKKPKWGWQHSGSLGQGGERLGLYPDSVMDRICTAHQINDAEIRNDLMGYLEYQALVYRSLMKDYGTRPRSGEVKAALSELSQDALGLLNKLENIDDVTWNYFWKAEYELREEQMSNAGNRMEEIGAWTRLDPETTGSMATFYELNNIRVALRFLELIASTAQGKVEPDPGGKPKNYALSFWVGGLGRFWVKDLNRPFTVDIEGGEGITPSYKFLRDCMEPLDPAAILKIPSMMHMERTEINLHRKRSG